MIEAHLAPERKNYEDGIRKDSECFVVVCTLDDVLSPEWDFIGFCAGHFFATGAERHDN